MILDSNKVMVVMYHYVRDLKRTRYPNIKGLDLDLFRKQIEFISSNFNVISTEQLLEAKYANLTLPKNPVLLSFDDGYIDHYLNVFPILKNYNLKGFFSMPARILSDNKVLDVNKIHFLLASQPDVSGIIKEIFEQLNYYRGQEYNFKSNEEIYKELAVASRFDTKEVIFIKTLLQYYLPEELRHIISDNLFKKFVNIDESCFSNELYLSLDQVKHMKSEGMYFGIHGYDHNWLNTVDEDYMKKDINSALDFYDGIIDKNNWVMCYPYGAYDDNVIDYIKGIGCVAGFTTDVDVYDIKKDNVFKIPRLDTNDVFPKSDRYKEYMINETE